jgi:hypothetical protein
VILPDRIVDVSAGEAHTLAVSGECTRFGPWSIKWSNRQSNAAVNLTLQE